MVKMSDGMSGWDCAWIQAGAARVPVPHDDGGVDEHDEEVMMN